MSSKKPVPLSSADKLPLPVFLKLLTEAGLPMDKAIAVASKIYKTCNTPAALAMLTDSKLVALHVEEKEQRKLVLAAIKKAGYKNALSGVKDPATTTATAAAAVAAASSSTAGVTSSTKKPSPKKRKRVPVSSDTNEFLPGGPPDEDDAAYGSLGFDELLDEQALATKSTFVNRAPVMTAWATVVAERMGFKRAEALSIASVYTEMNATSKGVKLGIFDEGRGKGMEPGDGNGQPYVDLMGRSPLFSTQSSQQWRALLKGAPVAPSSAHAYITNAFRQTTAHVLGAMRLLATTYAPQELNRVAFGLYADFRPKVDGWGKKGEVRCEAILALRKKGRENKSNEQVHPMVVHPDEQESESSQMKKPKTDLSLEEYEAALDEEGYDHLFAEIDT